MDVGVGHHVLNKLGVSNPFESIVLFNFPIYQNKTKTVVMFQQQSIIEIRRFETFFDGFSRMF